MNKITVSSITSMISAIMLGIGLGIVFVLPIVIVTLSSYFSDNDPDSETVLEETINGPLVVSTLPTLSFVLLLLGSIGLGVHSLLKKYYLATSFKYTNR